MHQLEVDQVLLADPGNRDLGDLDLVLSDQVQQEVERPLEDGKLDGIRANRVRDGGVGHEGGFVVSVAEAHGLQGGFEAEL